MNQSSVIDHTQRGISFLVVVAKKLKTNFAKVPQLVPQLGSKQRGRVGIQKSIHIPVLRGQSTKLYIFGDNVF